MRSKQWLAALVVVLTVVVAAFLNMRRQVKESEAAVAKDVLATHDLLTEAVLTSDSELFGLLVTKVA